MSTIILKNKALLGATENNTIVFAEVEVTTRNGFQEFTACFDEVSPFIFSEEYRRNGIQSLIDGCYTKEQLYDLCEQYDCSPSELVDTLVDRWDNVEDIEDISLYSDDFSIDGIDDYVYFRADGFGQNDTRDIFKNGIIINQELFDLIHELWDKYHLKEIPSIETESLRLMLDLNDCNTNEYLWIKEWLTSIKDSLIESAC